MHKVTFRRIKWLYPVFLLYIFLFTACKDSSSQTGPDGIIKDMHAEEFSKTITNELVQLIDVRTPEEFQKGYIAGAQLINYNDASFSEKIASLDKSKAVYVYCASGIRSSKASKIMKEAGFSEIYNLVGGFNGWISDQLPFEKE